MTPVDIARKLLGLLAALPPGEWRAARDPKDGVADAGAHGHVLRYEHPQEGLGLIGPYMPAWETCEFVTFARNHVEQLARSALAAEPGETYRTELYLRTCKETHRQAVVIDELRSRLELAETVVEAARAATALQPFDGTLRESDSLEKLDDALADYDAAVQASKEEHRKRLHTCPCCTCGQIELTWSDRVTYVFPDDHEGVVDKVMNCALDHSYDTTGTGVPYGLPDGLRDRLAPIVKRHMDAVSPDWHENTARPSDEQKRALRVDLLNAINENTETVGENR